MVEDGTESSAQVDALRAKVAALEERVQLLQELAYQDPLVPVPNRRGFMRELEGAISRVNRYGESAALLFVDIDGLKGINDSCGHQAGDQALIQVATALTNGVRKSDCVGRLGGDEFGILLSHASGESARETAERLASEIDDCEISFEGKALPLSVAIGIATIEQEDTPETVLSRADRAMYEVKSAAA